MIILSNSEPRDCRPYTRAALLAAAIALLAGIQALAPAPAAAVDDEGPQCTFQTEQAFLEAGGVCWEQDGETIVVNGNSGGYDPGPRPSGPGYDRETGRDGGLVGGPGPHGAGSGGGSGVKKPEPKPKSLYPDWRDRHRWAEEAWRRDQCIKLYRKIQRFWDDEQRISHGELGLWEWFLTGGPTTADLNSYLWAWEKDKCKARYQTDVY